MQKTFFGCAAVLPSLAAAGMATQDVDFTPNMAAQIYGDFNLAEPLSFGQVEAEDVEFWSNYLTLVQNSIAADTEEEPYWTDGYTSLSQGEVDNLMGHDQAAQQWGKGKGLSQIHAHTDSQNILTHYIGGVLGKISKFGDVLIDKAMAAVTPTQAQVDAFLKKNEAVKKMAEKIAKTGVQVANIAGNFLEKKVAPVAQIVSLLSVVPGFSSVANIAKLVASGSKNGGHILTVMSEPDDGTPKSCWIRSSLRKFTMTSSKCKPEYPEEGTGPICYQKCTAGSGLGPVCWGKCNSTLHMDDCGPLCLLKSESGKCKDVVKSVATSAISTGVSAGSGDVLGAILGGIAIASDLAYPICKEFN